MKIGIIAYDVDGNEIDGWNILIFNQEQLLNIVKVTYYNAAMENEGITLQGSALEELKQKLPMLRGAGHLYSDTIIDLHIKHNMSHENVISHNLV